MIPAGSSGGESSHPILLDCGPSNGAGGLQLRIRRAPDDGRPAGWVQEIRRFRAEILHDGGRRPGFHVSGEGYADPQDLDLGAFHLTAHTGPGHEIVACVRLAPPRLTARFQVLRHLGAVAYAGLLAGFGAARASVFEAGRLAVASGMRGRGVGTRMVAAMVAAGRVLGASHIICTSGTDDGQDLLFGRLGFLPCPGTDRYSAHYRDTVRVLAHRVPEGAGEFEAVTAKLRQELAHLSLTQTVRVPL